MITEEIYKRIKHYDSIVIFGHVFPDGDCFGSQIGLREAIKQTFPKKKVYAVGTGLSFLAKRLSGMDFVDDAVIAKSLAIMVDVGDQPRIEDQRYKTALEQIKIDHHIPEHQYALLEWVDTDAVATCEMVGRFVFAHKMKINKLGAEALALGIITDSGRFQYGGINSGVFSLMSELLRHDVDLPSIFDILYSVNEKDIRFRGYLSQNFQKTKRGVAYIILNKDVLKQFEMEAHRASVMVNTLGNIRGLPIWVIFAEGLDDVKVEIRSNGLMIQPIASKYGGGGHANAAGCRIKDLSVVTSFLADLDEVIALGGK